jgi:hypothetical protein
MVAVQESGGAARRKRGFMIPIRKSSPGRWPLLFAAFFLLVGMRWAHADEPATLQPTLVFDNTYGGLDAERGIFVTEVKGGGFIAVGSTRSSGEGEEDVYLVRTNAQGKELWSATFGGSAPDFGWSVCEVADGFVIAGFTESFGEGENDFYLVKASRDGDEVWSRTFGGEGNDRCWALTPTSDGGLLLVGETTSFGAGEQDVHLVKTDAQGEFQWSQTHGGEKSDRAFAVSRAADGFVLAGQTFSEGAGDRDAYVLKFSPEGELGWSRTFGGEASDVAHYVVRTDDGNFMVTGYTTSFGQDGDDPFLIKIDPQGAALWTRVIPLEGNNHTISGDQAADGGFYLVGFTEFGPRRPKAALLVKTDPEGEPVWHRNFVIDGWGETFGYTVRGLGDGGCVFTGHSTGKDGQLDLHLVRVQGED